MNVQPGDMFGRWVLVELLPKEKGKHRKALVKCSCEHGTYKSVRIGSLTQGVSTSCGCKQREVARKSGEWWATQLAPVVDNSTGYSGVTERVYPSGNAAYMARIMVGRKRIQIGTFDTPEEAHEAYMKAKVERAKRLCST